ncbi:hypothetical protein AMTRI_Chr05g68610 [Amborella trichopoda]
MQTTVYPREAEVVKDLRSATEAHLRFCTTSQQGIFERESKKERQASPSPAHCLQFFIYVRTSNAPSSPWILSASSCKVLILAD